MKTLVTAEEMQVSEKMYRKGLAAMEKRTRELGWISKELSPALLNTFLRNDIMERKDRSYSEKRFALYSHHYEP